MIFYVIQIINIVNDRWMVSEWGECSASCGGGVRIRVVNCVEEDNGTIIKVNIFFSH